MAVHGDNKLEEFQEAGAAIISAVAQAVERPAETLQNLFTIAHDEGTQRIQMNLVQQVWNGLTESNQLSIRLNGADLIIMLNHLARSNAQKAAQDHLFLATLNHLKDQIAALGRAVDDAERGFAERYGEAWREGLALEILDQDIIPQRMDGESLEDYRERVEDALMAELLDEDGNIKPDYANHPKYGEFAEWARDRRLHQQGIDAADTLEATLQDPTSTPEEKQEAAENAQLAEASILKNRTDDADIEQELRAQVDRAYDGTASDAGHSIDSDSLMASMGID